MPESESDPETSLQRAPTGFNYAARALILGALRVNFSYTLKCFMDERFLSVEDYLEAVAEVRGQLVVDALRDAVEDSTKPRRPRNSAEAQDMFALALLGHMPEPDFRAAVLRTFTHHGDGPGKANIVEAINRIAKNRRIEWEFDWDRGFVWIGDEEVHDAAMVPALTAIGDERFAGATRTEFDTARDELAEGTPASLKQCVTESSNAVESAMKVVLTEHTVEFGETDSAFRLFDHLVAAEVVPRFMERMVLGSAVARNKSGGHGAGVMPHDVPQEIAQAALASAAVAIAYLHARLP